MEFVRKNRSSLRSLGRKWEDMILPGRENPRNCVDPDEMKMRWKWDDVYRPGVSQICTPRHSVHLRYCSIPGHPPSLINDVLGGRDQDSWEMHLEAVIERVWRCTLRPWSWTQRSTGRPLLSEFGDALAGYDRAGLEKYLEAVALEGCATALYSVLTHDYGMERYRGMT